MPAQSTTEHFATNVRHASGCPGARRETGAGWCGKQYATYAAFLGRTWSTACQAVMHAVRQNGRRCRNRNLCGGERGRHQMEVHLVLWARLAWRGCFIHPHPYILPHIAETQTGAPNLNRHLCGSQAVHAAFAELREVAVVDSSPWCLRWVFSRRSLAGSRLTRRHSRVLAQIRGQRAAH